MHFRQKLQEAYKAGYRSVLKEQAPPLPSWGQIVDLLRSQFDNNGNPISPQSDYAIDLYDYNNDGSIDQFDLEFAVDMAELYPDRPFTNDVGSDLYQQWFIDTFGRPLPPREIDPPSDMRLRRVKPNTGTKKPGKKQPQGPYPPGGGRPMGPGGRGS